MVVSAAFSSAESHLSSLTGAVFPFPTQTEACAYFRCAGCVLKSEGHLTAALKLLLFWLLLWSVVTGVWKEECNYSSGQLTWAVAADVTPDFPPVSLK